MHALACQCVEEYGERRYEGLSFARGHLGDLALVEHHAAEELHVVVHHVPFDVVAAREPVGGVDGLVAVDRDEILRGGQLPVEIVGRDRDRFVLGETTRRILHDGERFGQDFVELLFDLLVDAFGDLVDLLRNLLFLFECGFGAFQLRFQSDDALLVGGDEIGDLLHQRLAPAAEFVVRKCGDGGVDLLDFVDIGFDGLAVFVRLRTEQEFDYTGYNIHTDGSVLLIFDLRTTKII